MSDAGPQLTQTHNSPVPKTLGNSLGSGSSSHPSSLTEVLPYEILVAILEELDWLDVLRVRAVSHPILAASRERSVWVAICKRHETQRLPNSHFLEKKMAVCTASELEAAFLRPRKSNAAWGTSTRLFHRVLNLPDDCGPLQILPGGRWVIATLKPHYDVVCFDLDARKAPDEKVDLFTLAENPFPSDGTRCIHRPAVVVDTAHVSSPYLTFNFAVFFNAFRWDVARGDLPDDFKFIQVWRVEPRYDTSGHIVGLGSTLLSSFELKAHGYGFGTMHSFALFGAYVLYKAPGMACVCIVEWEEASGRDFERRWLGDSSCLQVSFLSDNSDLILEWVYNGVSLYNFKSVPLTRDHENHHFDTRQLPVWSHRHHDLWQTGVGPLQTPGGLVFIQYCSGSPIVRSLIIPLDLSDPMTSLPRLEVCGVDEGNAVNRSAEDKRHDKRGHSKIVQMIKDGKDKRYLRHARLPWEHRKVRDAVRYSCIEIPPTLCRFLAPHWLDDVSGRILAGEPYACDGDRLWALFEILGDWESHHP